MVGITAEETKVFSDLVYKLCGIILGETKSYLIKSRLSPIVEKYGCKSFSELYYKIKHNANADLMKKEIVAEITTNETLFFRDNSPFDALKFRIIPDLIDKKSKQGFRPIQIKIWCAAVSTGQEIYSIAMSLHELFGRDIMNYSIRLMGTDISDDALKKAEAGLYTDFEIKRGVPDNYLSKYFTPMGNKWRIKDEVRSMIAFGGVNLMDPFYMKMDRFDIVFCRNVAIYFNLEDKKKLYRNIFNVLEPEGYLFIGSTETLLGISEDFRHETHTRATFYIKK